MTLYLTGFLPKISTPAGLFYAICGLYGKSEIGGGTCPVKQRWLIGWADQGEVEIDLLFTVATDVVE